MTRGELVESLALLKEQARNSGANTFVWDINIDSFNFVMDSVIKALDQEPILDRVRADQVTMLEEILKDFEDVELYVNTFGDEFAPRRPKELKKDFDNIIQQRIDRLNGDRNHPDGD